MVIVLMSKVLTLIVFFLSEQNASDLLPSFPLAAALLVECRTTFILLLTLQVICGIGINFIV
jgi:hypothetical protein